MVPPAPVMFSTMRLWPSVLFMRSPMMRANVSVPEPGGTPLMIVIGLAG
jgi:hypothetical protein